MNGSGARKRMRVWIALGALVVGIFCGYLISAADRPALNAAADALEPIGILWTRALALIVIPLVVSNIVVAVLTMGRGRGVGRLTVSSIAVFLALLAMNIAVVVMLSPTAISMLNLEPGALDAASSMIPEGAAEMALQSGGIDLSAWLISLVPTNAVRAAADGEILQLVLVTIVFSLAANRIAPEQVTLIRSLFVAMRDTTLVLVRWCLAVMAPAMFILALSLGRRTGLDAVPAIVSYVGLVMAFLCLGIVLLYAVAIVIGRARPASFCRALLPAQAVAIGTRSSLASLPALMEGVRADTTLSHSTREMILPLAAAMFKPNRGISSPLKLIFLAHVYGIDLEPGQILTFAATISLISLGAPGIPAGTGAMMSLPAYLQAGIPMEGYFLLRLVAPIPDVLKTVMNVTGFLTASTLVSRLPWKIGDPAVSLAHPTPSAASGRETST